MPSDTATVTINIDLTHLTVAFDAAGTDFRAMALGFAGRRPSKVIARAGAEARWYVRGAMHPDYADPADRDHMARALAKARRYDLAAAFLTGWVVAR